MSEKKCELMSENSALPWDWMSIPIPSHPHGKSCWNLNGSPITIPIHMGLGIPMEIPISTAALRVLENRISTTVWAFSPPRTTVYKQKSSLRRRTVAIWCTSNMAAATIANDAIITLCIVYTQ